MGRLFLYVILWILISWSVIKTDVVIFQIFLANRLIRRNPFKQHETLFGLIELKDLKTKSDPEI